MTENTDDPRPEEPAPVAEADATGSAEPLTSDSGTLPESAQQATVPEMPEAPEATVPEAPEATVPEAPAAPEAAAPEAPEATVPEAPEAPVPEAPEAPVPEAPEAPVPEAPEAPEAAAPEAPEAPEAPVVPEQEARTVEHIPPPSQIATTVAHPPRPAPAATGAAAPAVPEASREPARWGRIAKDGSVFVRLAEGEQQVGSWQAGTAEEGLAHFARRFDDLRTDAELSAHRLGTGTGDPKQVMSRVKALRAELAEPTVVGDIPALLALLDHLESGADTALVASKQAREKARADAVARKEALAEEAEKIGETSTQWKAGGDRLRAIVDEWKTIKGIDRRTDDALWKRFSKAREAFNRRRGTHFAELDRQRAGARERKEKLVAEAEALSESTEWGPTASRYRALMAEWKEAGRAPREADDALWQRFRSAQDAFFTRRSANLNERDSEFVENAKKKEALLVELENLDPSADLEGARARLRHIQERWESAGKVPRERVRELEARMRAAEEKVRSATEAQWRRTDPEAEARLAQFRDRVAQFEEQAAKARNAGDDRKAKDAEAQAQQWREWLAAAEQAVATR